MNNLVLMTEYMAGRMRRVFFMSYPESRADYKKSRVRYTVADSMAQTIAQLSGGTFLVMLMEALGFSDGSIGILSSFGCFAAAMQLLSIKLAAKVKKNKLMVFLTTSQRIWLAFIFFIPLFSMEQMSARILMIICYCFTYLVIQVGTPAVVDWIASLTPKCVRGRYFAIKDSAAVLTIIISTLIMGMVVDAAKATKPAAGFVALGVVIGIMVLIQAAAFAGMKEPKLSCEDESGRELIGSLARKKHRQEKEQQAVGMMDKAGIVRELRIAMKEKTFQHILILNGLWVTAFYVAAPFNASYQVKELSLPYTYIMILSFVTNLLRIWLAPRAGKLADRVGMARLVKWTLAAIGMHFLTMACSVPANAYVMAALAALFSSLGWTFLGTGMLALQLESFPEEKRIAQYSLFSVISGIYGFLVSVAAGNLLNLLQGMELVIGGKKLYAQQITNVIGCIFVVVTILYLALEWKKRDKYNIDSK